jgi:hypothetical protein
LTDHEIAEAIERHLFGDNVQDRRTMMEGDCTCEHPYLKHGSTGCLVARCKCACSWVEEDA